MTDNQAPLSRGNPADEAARETRHQILRELLGAYADRELPPETTAQIDAHLVGCVECRRELDIHDALRARLAAEPPAAPSPALRARIAVALDATPVPVPIAQPLGRPDGSRRHILWLALAGWVVAAVFAVTVIVRMNAGGTSTASGVRPLAGSVRAVPLLDGIMSDYARVSAGDLPGRARDLSVVRAAMSFPIEPLNAPNLRLLAAWTTDVAGEPAAVLAYRLEDRLVVQYVVAEDAFFRHPAVRAAVAERHLLTASSGSNAIAAWPEAQTGTVLVGRVPPRWLEEVWMTERTR